MLPGGLIGKLGESADQVFKMRLDLSLKLTMSDFILHSVTVKTTNLAVAVW